jgi:hypothetical protein
MVAIEDDIIQELGIGLALGESVVIRRALRSAEEAMTSPSFQLLRVVI